jgi:hypothetical protein
VIEVTELYVDGLTSKKEMDAARAAAGFRGAMSLKELRASRRPNRQEARAGLMAAASAFTEASREAELSARFAREAAMAAWQAEEAEEEAFQCEILRGLLGNPFRPISLDPGWLTPTVTNLAAAAYVERELPSGHLDAGWLGVLADALEDAGCDNAELLGHLRGPGPHVRGCWVVDLLLGRS